MGKKVRLDILLVERGIIETREKAKRTIMAGLVYSESARLDKPGMKVDEDTSLHVKGKLIPYVSRGGLKLEKAIKEFDLNLKGRVMIDVGSSTGGFTDCALQNGIESSYAIDVGYNQLDWKLRNDPRVYVMERTNFRYVTEEDLVHGQPDFASIDVSFISLRLILPVLSRLLQEESDIVALIKPQFEAGRDQVGKKGIVRDPKIHEEVVKRIIGFAQEQNYTVANISFSPITGGDGNIEFLAHFRWKSSKEGNRISDVKIRDIVEEAHQTHRKHA
ncbi:TlyA family RNA methyltransferase [Thalassobacillus devorans]|uniref:TlyA family RNA methyltransferase n=1 Tax=Thalassobacillus devorans TaxID=279813 RepID=UPI0004904417|nr:TlyA family RNA methyltransferase [Thalassobacillus devorans]